MNATTHQDILNEARHLAQLDGKSWASLSLAERHAYGDRARATFTTHAYDGDTDRCRCGGEVVWFDYREDAATREVIAHDGYGCAAAGTALHACCEGTPWLGHAGDCDERPPAVGGPMNPCTCNFGAYSVLLDDLPDDVNPHGPTCPLADDVTRKV